MRVNELSVPFAKVLLGSYTWKALRHANVLPLLGAIMTENQFAIVSEWIANRNINKFTRKTRV